MCLIGGRLSSEVGEDRSSNLLSRTFLFWRFITDSCNNPAFLRYVTVLLSDGALSESKR